jgi:hypothetical protein
MHRREPTSAHHFATLGAIGHGGRSGFFGGFRIEVAFNDGLLASKEG